MVRNLPSQSSKQGSLISSGFNIDWLSFVIGAVFGYSIYPAIKKQGNDYRFLLGLLLGYIGASLYYGKPISQIIKEGVMSIGK